MSTSPPETLAKQLALVIDLNVCVGCHACVTSCKQWNTSGAAGPLADQNAYGADPTGTFFNRVQTYEAGSFPNTETVHFPKSCLHCEDPPCVPVCPTGASYKRKEDGIVLVDYDKCIGCKYCAWACPYGARELDEERQVMTKCTLCVDRIYDELLPPQDRKPACVKACPTGARLFGDVKDPDSEVSAGDPRARRLRADARMGHPAGQPVPAAPCHARCQDRCHLTGGKGMRCPAWSSSCSPPWPAPPRAGGGAGAGHAAGRAPAPVFLATRCCGGR
jgi:Fe-S-cluster-containing dehydrogenase component